MSRRNLLAVTGGLLMVAAAPGTAAASTTRPAAVGTPQSVPLPGAARASRLQRRTTLVHADLHNHTVLSDGDGDPEQAFASMREAGLDVAALTDHATLSAGLLGILDPLLPPGASEITGISPRDFELVEKLADAADDPGSYTAIRGFEWSHPLLGHANVWFTEDFTDVLDAFAMDRFYDWLTSERWGLFGHRRGGAAGVAGFNHPGREPRRFSEFALQPKALDQMVSMEIFNRRDDYLFRGWSDGTPSPLVTCLNAGWRTGLTGVTDEHGDDWGFHEGKGRSGLWVTENTRAGVLAAMRARRFFATRVSGLRFDATADDVHMGGTLDVARRDVRFAVDLDRGPQWDGKPLLIQVLRPGTDIPEVADVIPARTGGLTRFTVSLDVADGDWVVLRVSDPDRPNDAPGPEGHPCNDWGVAYSSPWWLEPA
ncbi:CehA/McbA family metallohydrolase [Phytoactinopolyspora halotolerans]|uniref:CehA/McbA family metallohydrolase n=2 Tax=Phytoactinopolyspora halotolerans TaxID=1981512 RepID=A0A6L9S712_9ACTN|nr:CehA/McbA family metallohydrolase [Phytoactinopolyspora halotolerans]